MSEMFNFSEFYQKSPIPINERYRTAIQDKENTGILFEQFTHWLLALEGCELKKGIQWRVAIYPSNEVGTFDHRYPYFRSPYQASFHEACEALRELELKVKQDQFMNRNP